MDCLDVRAGRIPTLAFMLLIGLGLAIPVAAAEKDPYDDGPLENRLTGDWGGVRRTLLDKGLDFRAHFITETAGNVTGGRDQGARYAHQIDFGADLDFGKIAGLTGTRLHVTFSERAGRSLSADVIGNLISVQEIYGGGQTFRLSELSLEQSLLDGRIDFLVGRVLAGSDFAASPLYCTFQNNAFCGNPNGLFKASGFTSFPVPSWGARAKVEPTGSTYIQAGIYEVNPTLSQPGDRFKFGTSGATGFLVPVEFGWQPGQEQGGLPGNYKLGFFYDSSNTQDFLTDINGNPAAFTGLPFSTRTGRDGFYALADQMVYREEEAKERGLTLFGGIMVADPRTSLFQYFIEAGLVYQGTFPGRDDDKVGFAIADAEISDRAISHQQGVQLTATGPAPVQSRELDLELNYTFQVVPSVTVVPNLQYIIHPGAVNEIGNAFVLGLKTAIKF